MSVSASQLVFQDHNRDFSGLTYVYPVLSRRAGGVSVGINLNPNNACNWHCVYCQVPNLVRGEAPEIDLGLLERELRSFLRELTAGSFMAEHVPPGLREIRDLAFSGNGEPTSARDFAGIVALVARLRDEFGLAVPVRLITNGSLMARAEVQDGVARLSAAGGEVWFKLDGGTKEDIARINGANLSPQRIAANLATCADLCPTWVQTCLFRWRGRGPDEHAVEAYLDVLTTAGVAKLRGVLLYGLARPSLQPEAPWLQALPGDEMNAIAARIEGLGLAVKVSP